MIFRFNPLVARAVKDEAFRWRTERDRQVAMRDLTWDFAEPDQYYATAYHKCGHSTGIESRLARGLEKHAAFGSETYSREELVAELCSAFLCSHVDIDNTMNNAAYLKTWARKLRNEPTWIVWAASRAEKAAQYILD